MDIAAVLRRQLELVEADTVQLDEASIAGFPQDTRWAAEAINHVLDGILSEKAVHICFGNYGGQPMLTGFWRDLIPFLNSLHADHLVLEFARRGYDELEVFSDLDPKIGLGIGVIDIKDNEVESPELIAQRIEHIVKTIGERRLRYVHPDCGFWMLQRSVVDRKIRALVAGRDLFEGRLLNICRPVHFRRRKGRCPDGRSSRILRVSRVAPTIGALWERGTLDVLTGAAGALEFPEILARTHANRRVPARGASAARILRVAGRAARCDRNGPSRGRPTGSPPKAASP